MIPKRYPIRTMIIKVTLFPKTNLVLSDLKIEIGQLIAKLISMATSKMLKLLSNMHPTFHCSGSRKIP